MNIRNKETTSYEAEPRLAFSYRQLRSLSQISGNRRQRTPKVFELQIGAGLPAKRPVGNTKVEGTGGVSMGQRSKGGPGVTFSLKPLSPKL